MIWPWVAFLALVMAGIALLVGFQPTIMMACILTIAVISLAAYYRAAVRMHQTIRILEEKEEQWRAIVVNSEPLIYVVDVDGVIQVSEGKGLVALGVEPGQLVGRSVFEMYADHPHIVRDLKRALAGEVVRNQIEVQGVHFESFYSPLKNAEGEVTGLLGMSVNITEFMDLQRQLNQAQKMEAVGILAGGIAHDFNNLLQAILGYTQISIESMPQNDPNQDNLRQVVLAAERAATLTRQLLAYSRRQVLDTSNFDLNRMVEGTTEMLGRIIGEHIELVFRPGDPLGAVRGDVGQVEQVLMNLCVNSRDAMPDGGVLTIETEDVEIDENFCRSHPWANPGRYVMMSVADEGVGMGPVEQERVFEPFFTTKETGKGTGLGLATVYGIVKQHDGMIHLYSEPGEGTVVKVYLPLADGEAEDIPAKGPFRLQGGSETVLVAEDDNSLFELIPRILESRGYTVLSARDGREAVERFRAHATEIDLVLLDVVMPRMGGKEAFEKIREIQPEIPILFSSGYNVNAIHTEFVLHEGLELLKKPFSANQLLDKVREILDRR